RSTCAPSRPSERASGNQLAPTNPYHAGMSPHEARRLRRTLYLAAFLRALAIGLMAVLIGLYAARLGLSAQQIGVILSCALWGAALAALLTFLAGSRVHERTLLVSLCMLPVLGAAIFLAADDFKVLAAAAFV